MYTFVWKLTKWAKGRRSWLSKIKMEFDLFYGFIIVEMGTWTCLISALTVVMWIKRTIKTIILILKYLWTCSWSSSSPISPESRSSHSPTQSHPASEGAARGKPSLSHLSNLQTTKQKISPGKIHQMKILRRYKVFESKSLIYVFSNDLIQTNYKTMFFGISKEHAIKD